MMRNTRTSSTGSRRAGLTLIEVVAAIAILGTILVGIVLAKARLTRQMVAADRMAQMVEATDALITAWWTTPRGMPDRASGAIESDDTLVWRTSVSPNKELEKVGVRVVRVEVTERPNASLVEPGKEPLSVVVDLVVPDPQVEQAERRELERQFRKAAGLEERDR